MYPELFRIGSFPVNTYGVFLAIAFLCAIMITAKLAARDGLPRERVYDLCLWMLLAGLVGSKILMLFTEPEYRANPLNLLSLAREQSRHWLCSHCARTRSRRLCHRQALWSRDLLSGRQRGTFHAGS